MRISSFTPILVISFIGFYPAQAAECINCNDPAAFSNWANQQDRAVVKQVFQNAQGLSPAQQKSFIDNVMSNPQSSGSQGSDNTGGTGSTGGPNSGSPGNTGGGNGNSAGGGKACLDKPKPEGQDQGQGEGGGTGSGGSSGGSSAGGSSGSGSGGSASGGTGGGQGGDGQQSGGTGQVSDCSGDGGSHPGNGSFQNAQQGAAGSSQNFQNLLGGNPLDTMQRLKTQEQLNELGKNLEKLNQAGINAADRQNIGKELAKSIKGEAGSSSSSVGTGEGQTKIKEDANKNFNITQQMRAFQNNQNFSNVAQDPAFSNAAQDLYGVENELGEQAEVESDSIDQLANLSKSNSENKSKSPVSVSISIQTRGFQSGADEDFALQNDKPVPVELAKRGLASVEGELNSNRVKNSAPESGRGDVNVRYGDAYIMANGNAPSPFRGPFVKNKKGLKNKINEILNPKSPEWAFANIWDGMTRDSVIEWKGDQYVVPVLWKWAFPMLLFLIAFLWSQKNKVQYDMQRDQMLLEAISSIDKNKTSRPTKKVWSNPTAPRLSAGNHKALTRHVYQAHKNYVMFDLEQGMWVLMRTNEQAKPVGPLGEILAGTIVYGDALGISDSDVLYQLDSTGEWQPTDKSETYQVRFFSPLFNRKSG